VLRAAAQASRRTGAAISLAGPIPGEILRRALDVLESEGADLARVIVGGLDPLAAETERLEQLLARGVYLQFDMLGRYSHVRSRSSDRDVAAAVVALVRRGHARRILLSQDVRTKIQLKTYGGTGYSFVFEQFVPYLRRLGLTGDEIETILATNPARMLTLAEPKP
jgi:phosphotriesterase-related protein